jgi:hypothetical protein
MPIPQHPTHRRIPRDIPNDIVGNISPTYFPQVEHTTEGDEEISHVPRVPLPIVHPKPKLSDLYNTFHTRESWIVQDFGFNGTVTPTAGSTVAVPLVTPNTPNFQMNRFPRATSLYLGVQAFAVCPQSSPATPGCLEVIYVDPNGFSIFCGLYFTNTSSRKHIVAYSCIPITDTDNTTLGMLTFGLNSGASTPVFNYELSLCCGYLLPSDGYPRKEDIVPGEDGHPHPDQWLV